MSRVRDSRVLRERITRILDRRALTLRELQAVLADVPPNRVERELGLLVRRDVVCSRGDRAEPYTFETWGRVVARLREREAAASGRGARLRSKRVTDVGERIKHVA